MLLCSVSSSLAHQQNNPLKVENFGNAGKKQFRCVPVAQQDRVLGFEPRGRAFESLWAHYGIRKSSFQFSELSELARRKYKQIALFKRLGFLFFQTYWATLI